MRQLHCQQEASWTAFHECARRLTTVGTGVCVCGIAFDIPLREFIAGDRPLLAIGALHHPVAVRSCRRTLQGIDYFTMLRRSGENRSTPSPLAAADVLVGGLENVVAHGPTLSVGLDRPISRTGLHRGSRARCPRPRGTSFFGGDRPDPGE